MGFVLAACLIWLLSMTWLGGQNGTKKKKKRTAFLSHTPSSSHHFFCSFTWQWGALAMSSAFMTVKKGGRQQELHDTGPQQDSREVSLWESIKGIAEARSLKPDPNSLQWRTVSKTAGVKGRLSVSHIMTHCKGEGQRWRGRKINGIGVHGVKCTKNQ